MSDKVIPNLTKLTSLNNEIKRLSLVIRNLKLQKEETESEITKYLQEVNQPGIQYQNIYRVGDPSEIRIRSRGSKVCSYGNNRAKRHFDA